MHIHKSVNLKISQAIAAILTIGMIGICMHLDYQEGKIGDVLMWSSLVIAKLILPSILFFTFTNKQKKLFGDAAFFNERAINLNNKAKIEVVNALVLANIIASIFFCFTLAVITLSLRFNTYGSEIVALAVSCALVLVVLNALTLRELKPLMKDVYHSSNNTLKKA